MNHNEGRVQQDLGRRSLLKKVGVGAIVGFAAMLKPKTANAQSNPYSFWVHGNAARAQFPDRLNRVEYRSGGAVFEGKPGTENWFHIPISAPVFIRIDRPTLFGANLSLRATDGVFLREAKLFDGEVEKGTTVGLAETGEVFQRIDIVDPVYFFGLSISARIEFSEMAQASEVHIISAGVDLSVRE